MLGIGMPPGPLQILAQLADLGGEGLEGLCVRRGGLSVGSRDNDRCKNGA